MKLGRWSTTPGNNNATPPDGWPEGQAPSTVNDCARENMAAIRTAFADLQFFDQAMTPTAINATSFSVPGNQTSAIHRGRRLKLFDASTYYATVSTASFTTVTTIHVDVDDGQTVTSSLSSFGISVMSNSNNGMPRNLSLSVDTVQIADFLSVGGQTTLTGFVHAGSLSVSATAAAPNICKAFFRASLGAAVTSNLSLVSSFNVAAVSRSSTGCYRVTFTNAFADANYAPIFGFYPAAIHDFRYMLVTNVQASTVKVYFSTNTNVPAEGAGGSGAQFNGFFYHT